MALVARGEPSLARPRSRCLPERSFYGRLSREFIKMQTPSSVLVLQTAPDELLSLHPAGGEKTLRTQSPQLSASGEYMLCKEQGWWGVQVAVVGFI